MRACDADSSVTPPNPTVNQPSPDLPATLHQFIRESASRGRSVDPRLHWYHQVTLAPGWLTPGAYHHAKARGDWGLPQDLHGTRVLDVGSATGFHTFLFESRGARVTSIELPSLSVLDRFPFQPSSKIPELAARSLWPASLMTDAFREELAGPNALDLIHRLLLLEPYDFCHQALQSRAERVFSTVYQLQDSLPPRTAFDHVFMGDVLLHVIDPLAALAQAASLCAGSLVIAQEAPPVDVSAPILYWRGGENPDTDDSEWWWPNAAWFCAVLRKLGFSRVEVLPTLKTWYDPAKAWQQRMIIRATRQ
jgi:SAM-dependent methyltransferase